MQCFSLRFACLVDSVHGREQFRHPLGFNLKASQASGSDSLTELLDGLIMLYHVGVHKHYVKVNDCID